MTTSTVIVLSQRPDDWLAEALASVAEQADEVLLVDNGSEGAVASAIGRRFGARVLRSDTNRGFTGGVNLALSGVTTDLVALLNDDAVAGPGWLAAAAATLADPGVAAVGPKVVRRGWYRELVFDDRRQEAPGDPRVLGRQLHSVRADGVEVLEGLAGVGVHRLETDPDDRSRRWRWTIPGRPLYVPVDDAAVEVDVDGETCRGSLCRLLDKAGSYLRSDGVLGDHGDDTPDDGRWDQPAERFCVSGTALVARTETFARIGALAEPFFAYYEDADWGWRARLGGLRLLYDPGVTVVHRRSATSGGAASAGVSHLALRNRVLCLVRNAPRSVALGAVRRRLTEGRLDGVRRETFAKLPWAARSRSQLARGWRVSPQEVWDRWADVDTTWDTSPAQVGSAGY